MHTRTWEVQLYVFEDEDRTRAEAVLHLDGGSEVRHVGIARRNPRDRNVPEIGEELAVARALTGLGHDLLEAAVADVAENVSA